MTYDLFIRVAGLSAWNYTQMNLSLIHEIVIIKMCSDLRVNDE